MSTKRGRTGNGHRRTPVDQDRSMLWTLDDNQPAGPYGRDLDEDGLRLVCLAVIRQAVMDVKSSKNPEVTARARAFLSGTARFWLKAMKVSRAGDGNDVASQLIYSAAGEEQLPLLEEDQPDPGYDEEGGASDLA